MGLAPGVAQTSEDRMAGASNPVAHWSRAFVLILIGLVRAGGNLWVQTDDALASLGPGPVVR